MRVQKGSYVLLWLQASVRSSSSHALEFAIEESNGLRKPLIALFVLCPTYPEANQRHYAFLMEGLADTGKALRERGIPLVVREGDPAGVTTNLARDAYLVVTDRGYLRHQREWRARVAESIDCPLIQVESDVVIPVERVSGKEEYSAATIRPKIKRLLHEFLVPVMERRLHYTIPDLGWETKKWDDPHHILNDLEIDRSVSFAKGLPGGLLEARKRLKDFIASGLERFAEDRNDPARNGLSGMSPYLHFGHISPLEIALTVRAHHSASVDDYLEELIIRRELSMNFVHYNQNYDSLDCLPAWAKKTLEDHSGDRREFTYSFEEFEKGRTHDRVWNAAQLEMIRTGKMHGYMRMYWGKKILEWTETPEEAFRTALILNNRYELDGRDPNGYAGIAWCFGKHDRPWGERQIFGKVRYMGSRGLGRKFDIEAYIGKIS